MTGPRKANALSPVGAVAGSTIKTLGYTLAGLGVLGGLGYVGWRLAKAPKSLERQSADNAEEQALSQLEQQAASGQKGGAQAEGAAKAKAEGTDKLASVTFEVVGTRGYGWTTKIVAPKYVTVPVNGQVSFDAREDTLTKQVIGKPDWAVTPKLSLDPTLGELVLRVGIKEHTVFGALQDLGPMKIQGAQSGEALLLGGLLALDNAVRSKKGAVFFSEIPTPDVVISFTPVTYAYR